MIFSFCHLIACLVLIGAAIYQRVKFPGAGGTHRVLFPFAMVCGLLAVAMLLPWAMEWFVGEYGSVQHSTSALVYRFTGPYAWVYWSTLILPFAPTSAIFPAIGRRPTLVAALGLIAILPFALRW